ncbi:MAG: UDP-N-acetylmuramoyl-L-alanine--D-glutamate ligase, partial [Pseudomonadota bacterium]
MREPAFSLLKAPAPMELKGKRVLVLGLGDTGLSVARWVERRGGRVRVADTRKAPPRRSDYAGELRTGEFKPSLLRDVDLLCISPGLSLKEKIVETAIARGIPVVGDIELFAWAGRGKSGSEPDFHAPTSRKSGSDPDFPKVLAVTGTNGKSTVTALTAHLLGAAGVDTVCAGNIGPPALAALANRDPAPEVWVLELSSYQLETTWSLAPHAAAMLNLCEDHLDRYAGLAEYAAAKARVFQGSGVQVLNRCDSASMALAVPGRVQVTFGMDPPPMPEDFGIAQGWLCRGQERILQEREFPLSGAHNVSNALAACALACLAGVPPAALGAGL